jgi:hypothetical protein
LKAFVPPPQIRVWNNATGIPQAERQRRR